MVKVALVCVDLEGRFLAGTSATVAKKRAWGWNLEHVLVKVGGLIADCLIKRESMIVIYCLASWQKRVD